MFGVSERLVFVDGQFGAEQEVLEGVAIEDAVDDDVVLGDFEVDAEIFGAVAVKFFSAPIDRPEWAVFIVEVFQVLSPHLELVEQF